MGSDGSGLRESIHRKLTVEECKTIYIDALRRNKRLMGTLIMTSFQSCQDSHKYDKIHEKLAGIAGVSSEAAQKEIELWKSGVQILT